MAPSDTFSAPFQGGVDGTMFFEIDDFALPSPPKSGKIDGTMFFTLPWGVGWVCAQN